jgi:hypothetical protein
MKDIEDKSSTSWHTLTVEETLKRLASGPRGLTADEATKRLH